MDDNPLLAQADEALSRVAPEPSLMDHANAALLGVPPEQARERILQQAIEQAKQRYEGRSTLEQVNEFNLLNVVPFASSIAKGVLRSDAAESMKRIEAGNYNDQDLSRVAYWHVRDEAAGKQGLGRKLVGAAGGLAALAGEQYLTAGATRLIPGLPGGGVLPAVGVGSARAVLQTGLMPSLYAEAAQQRAESQGGSMWEPKNIGPAFVEGVITNKILGSMGKAGEALASRVPSLAGRVAARAATGAVLMPAEQQLADTATSVTDELLPTGYQFNTHYGLMGDLLHGKQGDAGQHFAIQALTGAMFAAAHTPGHEAERQAAFQDALDSYNQKLAAMARRGGSSQRVFDSATQELANERQAAQTTPPATDSGPQKAAGATIAPSAANVTPAASVAAQAPPASVEPAPASAGPAPLGAGERAALEKSLGLKPGEFAKWKQKNPEAAAALEGAAVGRQAQNPGKAASFEAAPVEGPFSHPELEAGGARLLAEMRASKEYGEVAKAVPEGSKPIGRPNDAFVFETPDGKILRISRDRGERPDLPQMLKPDSVQKIGRFRVETLPKADRVGDPELFRQHAKGMRDAVEDAGYRAPDLHPDNIGLVDGKPVFIDPDAVRPMTETEKGKLNEARAARAGQPPADQAARSSPPEPAAAPGAKPSSWQDPLVAMAKSKGVRVTRFEPGQDGGRALIDGQWFRAHKATDGSWAVERSKLTKEERTALMRLGQKKKLRDVAADAAGVDVAKDAKALGVHPEEYHGLAAEYLSSERHAVDTHNALLEDARKALDEFGGAARMLRAWSAGGKRNAFEDASMLRGIDQVAEQSAKDYPGQYRDAEGNKEHLTDQLFEKLLEGKREIDPAKVKKAYDRAYAEIEHAKEVKDAIESAGQEHSPAEIAEALRSGEEDARHEDQAGEVPPEAGDAHEGNVAASGGSFDPSEWADAVEPKREARVPTAAEAIGVLRSDRFKAAFQHNKSRLKMIESMADRLEGAAEDVGARTLAKKFGMSAAALLKAEARILEKAGFPDATVQKIRDVEQANRAMLHKGAGAAEGLVAAPPAREHPADAARDRVTDKLLAGEKLSPEDLAVFGQPLSPTERFQSGVGGVHGQFGMLDTSALGAKGPPMRETALANAVVDKTRAARGEPPLMTAARKAFGVSWDEAMAKLDADPKAATRLIDELTAKPRVINDVESSLLMHRQVMLHNEHERALMNPAEVEHVQTGPRSGETRAKFSTEQRLRIEELRQQLNQLDQVTKAVGTQNARALAIRAQMVKEDFSLSKMMRAAEAAAGRPLTEAEESQVRAMQKKITDLQGRLDAAEAKAKEASVPQAPPEGSKDAGLWRKAANWFRGLFGETNKAPGEAQKGAVWQTADRWEKEATAELSAKLGGKLFSGFDPTLIAPITKYVAAKIVKGGYNFAEFSKAIVDRFGKEVEPHVDDIWRRADAMAKRAAEPQPAGLPVNSRERVAVERAKQEFQASLTKAKAKSNPYWVQVADYVAGFERGMILSGPRTLVKLTSAAVQRMVLTPIEELAGSAIGRLVPGVASRAPREGGFSWRAEAKAITGLVTSGMRDAWETMRTGKSSLDVLYGDRHAELPPSIRRFMDFFGYMHGALKAPVKRAEFERSYQKRTEWGLANGVDVNNPGVQMAMGVAAYKDANRAIFLQDNAVVDGYNRMLARWEKPDAETGRTPIAGKLGATAARVALPIVRVPTNVVAEALTHMFGSVTGSVQAARAYARGIENLKPGEADAIMRQLKKGSLGMAGLTLGYLGASGIGGYYQHGQKRDERDVGAGQARVFGVDVPKSMLHNPLLETLQVGATARRVAEAGRKGQEPNGLATGIMKAMLGLAEEVPFVRETGEIDKAMRSPGQAANEMAKRLIVPAGVTQAAEQFDRNAEGDRVKRVPHGPAETIQSGIPGLRNRLEGPRRGGRRQ